MVGRICRCGLSFDAGRAGYGLCPSCSAMEAATTLQSAEGGGTATPNDVLTAIGVILQAVAAWPQILIPGECPGTCIRCTRYVSIRHDGYCWECMELNIAETEEAFAHEGFTRGFESHINSYAGKHG